MAAPKSSRAYPFETPGGTILTPHHKLVPLSRFVDAAEKDFFVAAGADGAGGVVLTTQLSGAHSVAGEHAVAMVVNDAVRSGPLSGAPLITDVIDFKRDDEDNFEREEILRGISKAALKAGAIVAAGETAQSAAISGTGSNPYNVNCSLFALIHKCDVISHKEISAGNVVVGLRSAGMHSNGWSAAQELLGCGSELLKKESFVATEIYSPALQKTMRGHCGQITGCEHITGNGWLKLEKHVSFSLQKIGFLLDCFEPHEVFEEIHSIAKERNHPLGDLAEMFRHFNMGWGFALFVKEEFADGVINSLRHEGVEAKQIGFVTDSGRIEIAHAGQRFVLTRGKSSH